MDNNASETLWRECQELRAEVRRLREELEATEVSCSDEEASHQDTILLWKLWKERAETAEAEVKSLAEIITPQVISTRLYTEGDEAQFKLMKLLHGDT